MGSLNRLSRETGSCFSLANSHRFTGCEALFSCCWAQGCSVWPGAGITCFPVVPPSFYLLHVNVGLSHPWATTPNCYPATALQCHTASSPPLLPFWVNISCLNPWLSDFHTVRFSGSSGCFLFLDWLLSFLWLGEGVKQV